MRSAKLITRASILLLILAVNAALAQTRLLNVSYDPTRELYRDIDTAFAAEWKQKTGQDLKIAISNGGSGKQARAVLDGLQADVVTLGLGYDIDVLADNGVVAKDWQSKFDHDSAPYTSTVVFLVRKGNPKGIHDFPDLIKSGVQVITANPKTSSGARWNFLAVWGDAYRRNGNSEAKAREFVAAFYKNVPVLDSGARASASTFVQREIGDVLLTWENEAYLVMREFGPSEFEIVTPPESILAEPPVAVVDKYTQKHKTGEVARAYLQFLYSDAGQDIIGKNFYRPTSKKAQEKYASQFKPLKLYTFQSLYGTWRATQKKYFADGGVFDQIYSQPK